MAKNDGKSRSRRGNSEPAREVTSDLGFGKKNAAFFVAGLIAIAIGYVLLAQGSIAAAPVLLVLGYVVLMPLAIML